MGPSRIAAKITRWLSYSSQSSGPCPGSSPGSIVSVVERSEGGGGRKRKATYRQDRCRISWQTTNWSRCHRETRPSLLLQPALSPVEAYQSAFSAHRRRGWLIPPSLEPVPLGKHTRQCLEKRRVISPIQLELLTDLDSELQSPCVHQQTTSWLAFSRAEACQPCLPIWFAPTESLKFLPVRNAPWLCTSGQWELRQMNKVSGLSSPDATAQAMPLQDKGSRNVLTTVLLVCTKTNIGVASADPDFGFDDGVQSLTLRRGK